MLDRQGEQELQPGSLEFERELERLNAMLLLDIETALDAVDYQRLRRLARSILAGHRAPDNQNWDIPPASLQQTVAAVTASRELLDELQERRVLSVIAKHSESIQPLLCREALPVVDGRVVEEEWLSILIRRGKSDNQLVLLDSSTHAEFRVSETQLADALVVTLGESVVWQARPRIDEKAGARRLKLLSIIGQVTAGGLLAVANLSLGVAGTLSGVIPALLGGAVPIYAGLATSTYTGANGTLGGLKDLAKALEDQE